MPYPTTLGPGKRWDIPQNETQQAAPIGKQQQNAAEWKALNNTTQASDGKIKNSEKDDAVLSREVQILEKDYEDTRRLLDNRNRELLSVQCHIIKLLKKARHTDNQIKLDDKIKERETDAEVLLHEVQNLEKACENARRVIDTKNRELLSVRYHLNKTLKEARHTDKQIFGVEKSMWSTPCYLGIIPCDAIGRIAHFVVCDTPCLIVMVCALASRQFSKVIRSVREKQRSCPQKVNCYTGEFKTGAKKGGYRQYISTDQLPCNPGGMMTWVYGVHNPEYFSGAEPDWYSHPAEHRFDGDFKGSSKAAKPWSETGGRDLRNCTPESPSR